MYFCFRAILFVVCGRKRNEDLADWRQLNAVAVYKGEVLYFLPFEFVLDFTGELKLLLKLTFSF